MNFLYCFDCEMMDYALPQKGGSFNPTTACSKHTNCRTHIFGDAMSYSPPIRNVLLKLHGNVDLTQFDIMCFQLAVQEFNELPINKRPRV